MQRLDFQWQSGYDSASGAHFLITRNSEFIELLPAKHFKKLRFRLFQFLAGLPSKKRTSFFEKEPLIEDLLLSDDFFLSHDEEHCPPLVKFHRIDRSNLIASAASSTEHYAKLLKLNGIFPENRKKEAIKYCKRNLVSKNSKDCLYTSINQFGYLSACDLPVYLYIAGFYPVRKMHAWVELDGVILFDHMEEVKHFKPLLRIFNCTK